jgi:hypothetical protein
LTAQAAEHAAKDLARAGGGLGEYYSERETRTPVWLLAGDTHTVTKLLGQWRADTRGLQLDRAAFDRARAPFDRARLADAAEKIEKPAFTGADLVEIIGAQLPVDSERTPRELVESAVDEIGCG